MGWLDNLVDNLDGFNRELKDISGKGRPPRYANGAEQENWYEKAATQQPPKTRGEIIAAISRANPVRYARLRREYRWMQKQAVKLGLSPEDARYLL